MYMYIMNRHTHAHINIHHMGINKYQLILTTNEIIQWSRNNENQLKHHNTNNHNENENNSGLLKS